LAPEAEADAHLLVTCTVVERTERDMVKRIRALAASGKPLVVAGCMAAAQARVVARVAPGAYLVPPRKWPQVADLFAADTACAERARGIETAQIGYHDAIVPIAQGCIGRCTYCITRVARGRVASYPADDLVSQVRRHVERGVKEIKLTGQDTAAWGVDVGANLADLLAAITAIPGEFRVRVGMADPLAVHILGNIAVLFVAAFFGALVFICFGFFVSSISKSADSAENLTGLITFPMFFLGGVFIPIERLPEAVQILAYMMPLTYFSDALRQVMIRGAGIVEIGVDLGVLAIFAVVVFALAVKLFRWE